MPLLMRCSDKWVRIMPNIEAYLRDFVGCRSNKKVPAAAGTFLLQGWFLCVLVIASIPCAAAKALCPCSYAF